MDSGDDHALPIVTADGCRCLLPAQAVGRSKLLQDLMRHAPDPGPLIVPIGDIEMLAWIEYVARSEGGSYEASAGAQQMDIDAMQRLLQVCFPAPTVMTRLRIMRSSLA